MPGLRRTVFPACSTLAGLSDTPPVSPMTMFELLHAPMDERFKRRDRWTTVVMASTNKLTEILVAVVKIECFVLAQVELTARTFFAFAGAFMAQVSIEFRRDHDGIVVDATTTSLPVHSPASDIPRRNQIVVEGRTPKVIGKCRHIGRDMGQRWYGPIA